MNLNNFWKLVIAIVISEGAGIVGAAFTTPSIRSGWYASLAKPALSPPAWLFGPVWITLYALMSIALWLVWKSDSKHKQKAIWFFGIQLYLNTIWSPIFFGARSPSNGFVIIVLLWVAIALTIAIFKRISRPAAWLLVPYILWVTLAAYLNYAIWQLVR